MPLNSANAEQPPLSWRTYLFIALATAMSLSAVTSARAETYPSKTITIVVGFAPGGLIDVIARLVGQKLQGKLGQTVIVENRAGAAGNLAHRRVAAAEPDGYTILGATTSLPINETLYPKRGYTADDFKAISIAATSPEMISAPPSGAKTLKEFVDNARSSTAQFGTAGAGSASYIVTQYFFERLAKVPTTHIPFQGGAPAVTAAMGNQNSVGRNPSCRWRGRPRQGRSSARACNSQREAHRHPARCSHLRRKRLPWFRRFSMDRLFLAGENPRRDRRQA